MKLEVTRKIEVESHIQKVSYDVEHTAPLNQETEYHKEYPGHYQPTEIHQFAYQDNLKNEGKMYLNPTQKDHFKNFTIEELNNVIQWIEAGAPEK